VIICSRCGYENQLGHIFCTRCRTKLNFKKLSEQELLKPKKSFGRKWRHIMLAVVFMIVAATVLACWPLPIAAKRGTSVDWQQARRKIALIEQGGIVSPQIFSESELNACLAALETRWRSGTFELRSVHVKLKPNAVVLFVVASWEPLLAGGIRLGPFQITHRIIGVPEIGATGFHFAVSRSMIGHLPLPGPLGLMLVPQIKAYFRMVRHNYPVVDALKRLEMANGKIIVYLRK